MLSLRKRAWISGGVSALAAIFVGTLLLYTFLDQRVLERFDRSLTERHTQIVVALNSVSGEPGSLGDMIFDPVYQTPYSGRYWQVVGPDGQTQTSASLFESTLPEPESKLDGVAVVDAIGPEGELLRIAYQVVTLEDGSEWKVTVAESQAELIAARSEMRRSLVAAFAMVAALGLVSVLLQTAAIVRPLNTLRKDVAERWDRDEELTESHYPEEVAPLVADINTLLQRNRDIVSRSRRYAADLAHALKTPSAILRNELTALSEQNHDVQRALDALDRVDAQLARSLARIRGSNTGEATSARTDLSNSVNRLSRLFGSMAKRDGKHMTTQCEADLSIRVDAQDIEEVMGNLLDNALKWCRSSIALSARRHAEGIEILIEDDGPGIAETDRAEALRSGGRLDTSTSGTGLGLAIAIDLLQAYDAGMSLETSPLLGGLAVRVLLPPQLVRP
jgi:signal transduction histidine kinase